MYGKSKLAGEDAIRRIKPTGSIIRTSWLYSRFGNSFVKTIYNYASEKESLNVIYDQVETPTNGNPCVIRG
ncbi:MAG: sugar nucleotide-binding protein [Bdellovibrio sp.]